MWHSNNAGILGVERSRSQKKFGAAGRPERFEGNGAGDIQDAPGHSLQFDMVRVPGAGPACCPVRKRPD